ncbi:unnamed protein product, partial [Rotaria magnacalcarata]
KEKKNSSKPASEQTNLSSSPTETPRLGIDEAPEDVTDENESLAIVLESSTITTTVSNESINEKSLTNPYILPSLPDPVLNSMQSKQMEKFEKLCNFRSIILDAVYYDLKNNHNLLYVVSIFTFEEFFKESGHTSVLNEKTFRMETRKSFESIYD